jgi:hypothetical protein
LTEEKQFSSQGDNCGAGKEEEKKKKNDFQGRCNTKHITTHPRKEKLRILKKKRTFSKIN